MTRNVAISLGHNPSAPGKTDGSLSEFSLMAPVFGKTISILMSNGVGAWIVPSGPLNHKIHYVNDGHYNLAVEIHANASNETAANGCEVLYFPTSTKGPILASSIQDQLVVKLPLKDRGTKPGYYQGDPANGTLAFLQDTKCPAVIVEPGFMTNPSDRSILLDKPDVIAEAIALGILSGLQKLGE